MVRVKICGITNEEDALAAAHAGADMLGLNFYIRSPRYINLEAAAHLGQTLRQQLADQCPLLIGVFVDATVDVITRTIQGVGLDAAQLSGDESIQLLGELHGLAFKAIRPSSQAQAEEDLDYYAPLFPKDERLPSILVDAYHRELYGGSGETASKEVALAVRNQVPRLMLAGGLNAENVTSRIKELRPWGVDVASGIEDDQPGIKSINKMRMFIEAAKSS